MRCYEREISGIRGARTRWITTVFVPIFIYLNKLVYDEYDIEIGETVTLHYEPE